MINAKEPITGVIETDNKPYSFYLKDYSLVFMDAEVNSPLHSIVRPVDGFAQATTHNGRKMLLYAGEHDYTIVNTMRMGIPSYIVSIPDFFDYDILHYDGIVFVGGTLSKLTAPRSLRTQYDEEKQRTYIEHDDDTQTFSFGAEGITCDCTIGSTTTERWGVEGRSIRNEKVYFQMLFSDKQETSSVYKHYRKICELLSFLTNRQNVGFEEIYLLQKDVLIGDEKRTMRTAQVFIEQQKILTEKRQFFNLEFALLGDSIGKLLEVFYNPQEGESSYSLGFYPENDENENVVNNAMVRAVCSALECELEFVSGITSDEKKKIKALTRKIKPIIEEHKASEDRLKDKTYDVINSSMSHWSMATADQIKALYHMYEEEMLNANKSGLKMGDEEIQAFVKYRNDITHGSYRVLDISIAYTTHLLARLVYCCLLTRVGVPRENIKEWIREGRL